MLTYAEAREVLAAALVQAAAHHDEGRYDQLEANFDSIDAGLPRAGGPELRKLFIGLMFWDGWIDASINEWRYYPGLHEGDWPKLAREIAASLRNDAEIDLPIVLAHFGRWSAGNKQ